MTQTEAKARAIFGGEDVPAEDRDDLAHCVQTSVRHGFEDDERIAEGIVDFFPDVTDSIPRLASLVRAVRDAHHAELATLPPSDHFQRLARAFDALSRDGVVALHAAGTTQSDGFDDASEVAHALADEGRPRPVGYVFYHRQDLDAVVEGHGLHLAFGSFDGTEAMVLGVGTRVRTALRAEGLDGDWDGTVGTRLHLPGVVWRKRLDEADWGLGRTLRLLPT